MSMTTETVKMVVEVRLRYDTKQARKCAFKEVREGLKVKCHANGDVNFDVNSGRVSMLPPRDR